MTSLLGCLKRKTIWTWGVAMAMVSANFSGTAALGQNQPIRVKLATLAPKGSSFHQILQRMGQQWRAASGGRVTLTIFTDGTQGSEVDTVRRMRVGELQAALLTVGGLSEIDASAGAIQNMPMMFRSLDEAEQVRVKLQPGIEKHFRDKGFVVLFWGDAGWVRFFSKQPGLRPDDFKKMKMFVSAEDNNQIDIMKAVGWNPVPLEATDILTGLQTGLIDAVPTTPEYALAGQFYGQAPHMLEINWAPLVGGAVIKKETWESIPPATRQALFEAAAEAGKEIQAKSRAESDESVEAMKKRGSKVHPMSPDIEADWRKTAEAVYPKIRGTMVPADLFDEVVRLLQEYRASGGRSAR